ncbi:hypothetical protein TorRG33x02_273680 [Trema orientale]|uniref:Uncharacterized protein n=1 Tax=Trema orientale TaxID=63057 RepID=A0A2P5CT20_TREOI|nr:hypothetical protein TorRG33x02_273680 [Trema orientale]
MVGQIILRLFFLNTRQRPTLSSALPCTPSSLVGIQLVPPSLSSLHRHSSPSSLSPSHYRHRLPRTTARRCLFVSVGSVL